MHAWMKIHLYLIYTGMALSSGNEYYFFTKVKEQRATENGYWKEIGVPDPIFSSVEEKVGIKKYLVFHVGEAKQGSETSWIMQEYHICSSGCEGDTTSYQSARRRRKHVSDFNSLVI